MEQQLKSLRKSLSRREFVERTFNKSGSVGSRGVVESALQKVYGVRYNPKSKSQFDQLTFEGSRIK